MMESQTERLYRSAQRLLAAALIATLAVPANGQLRTAKTEKGPRAIAVIRWQTGGDGKAVPRLIPVAILEEGKYYDASLYRATPRPMALDSGVVYEAQDKGETVGYFTIKGASRSDTTKRWFGLGDWQNATGVSDPELRGRPQTSELVKEVSPSPPAKTSPIFTESVDDRDIQKKTTVYDEEGRPLPEGQAPPNENEKASSKRKQGDIDRLPQVAPPKKETPQPTSSEDDPDRPKLKRGTPGQTTTQTEKQPDAPPASTPAAATPAKPADDPDRPILKRGSGQQKVVDTTGSAGTAVPGRVQARGDVSSAVVKQGTGLATRTFETVAVSDAGDTDRRSDFRFRWDETEREELTTKMRALAQQEAEKFVSGMTLAPTPRTPRSAKPSVTLTERGMAALDIDRNNSAELIYSASGPAAGKTIYVTVVARVDLQGNPRKITSVVTASDRLDVLPRLELVDAVDADGDGRAELLFRKLRDRDAEFVIYRIGADSLTELFRGGAAE
jgi:hypothetical protein